MKKILYITILLVFRNFFPLFAQTGGAPQLDTNTKVVQPVVSNQAPDDLLKKLSGLIHAGKYEGAQQLATGLLVAYPNDQRLIQAKALLDKLPASAGSANKPADDANASQLKGIERVDYNALIELAREAQQKIDLQEQKTLLQQFMEQSSAFLQKHPSEILLWQLRAASAISLGDQMEGFEAGSKLLAMGAGDSNDLNMQQLLVKLKNNGWTDNANPYNHSGYAKINVDDYADAIIDLDLEIALNTKYADAYNNRGYAYFKLGKTQQNYRKAIADYDMAIQPGVSDFKPVFNNRDEAVALIAKVEGP